MVKLPQSFATTKKYFWALENIKKNPLKTLTNMETLTQNRNFLKSNLIALNLQKETGKLSEGWNGG